ncbi:arsenate reductase [Paraburkholderia atlantica]|uniref:Protein-tyrosine-phosphatase n=1 Tax=Paraburkholderia atlantica TaxID=2654982 RepID=A0A6I1PR59_PARAM|nr:arsenate reductase ArsC [Paraburkholderia atlantica]MBB5422257.1 protein-tyrosine-phosphatase [Paraburkholderia atlantica]MPW05399.1 arsenate reductase ArsC [Paraburkholderia atlantica]NUY30793.1 arsenate reductase ArsC [Paraburkholderia atlantica]
MSRKYKVLFLCRDNSIRSIIAEALLRELAGHRFEAFSAGPEPAARLHPLAVAQLQPGISGRAVLSPKSWLEFTGEWAPRMDIVIALDESVGGLHAPVFPGAPAFVYWTIADPLAGGQGSADEQARLFDKTFWQIVRQVSAFIELPQYAQPASNRANHANIVDPANAINAGNTVNAANTVNMASGGAKPVRGTAVRFETTAIVSAPSSAAACT